MSAQTEAAAELSKRLGANIKRARIERGLTQGQLAGGDITRNMLSLIENGSAMPSLSTLCLIAKRLELPAGALIDDLSGYNAVKLERELHALLVKGKFEQLLERFESTEIDPLSCEAGLVYILKQALVGCARERFYVGKLEGAARMLERFESAPPCPGYDTESLEKRAFILRLMLAGALGRGSDEAQRERLHDMIYSDSEDAIYIYACELLEGARGKAYSVPDDNLGKYREILDPLLRELSPGFVRTHIEAKLKMCAADYLGAKALMLPLLVPELPRTLLCELCADLEHCCKCCGDFENAYKYSTRRLEIVRSLK